MHLKLDSFPQNFIPFIQASERKRMAVSVCEGFNRNNACHSSYARAQTFQDEWVQLTCSLRIQQGLWQKAKDQLKDLALQPLTLSRM